MLVNTGLNSTGVTKACTLVCIQEENTNKRQATETGLVKFQALEKKTLKTIKLKGLAQVKVVRRGMLSVVLRSYLAHQTSQPH